MPYCRSAKLEARAQTQQRRSQRAVVVAAAAADRNAAAGFAAAALAAAVLVHAPMASADLVRKRVEARGEARSTVLAWTLLGKCSSAHGCGSATAHRACEEAG